MRYNTTSHCPFSLRKCEINEYILTVIALEVIHLKTDRKYITRIMINKEIQIVQTYTKTYMKSSNNLFF